MAIRDKKLVVSNEQAITATAVSADKLDLNAAEDPGFGEGNAVRFVFQVETDFDHAHASDGTLTIQVAEATAENLTTNQNIVVQSGAIPEASLVKGFRLELPVPAGDRLRFLGARYLVGGTGDFVAGRAHAWFEAL